jgi:cephalosporin hydroxylase
MGRGLRASRRLAALPVHGDLAALIAVLLGHVIESSSTGSAVADRMQQLRDEFPVRVFAILDSDHAKQHVLAELKLLRPLLGAGDYVVVEDSSVNGRPVLTGWSPGPYEAIEEYVAEFPGDYTHDSHREGKFGWSFATNGFFIRNQR